MDLLQLLMQEYFGYNSAAFQKAKCAGPAAMLARHCLFDRKAIEGYKM